MPEIRLEKLCKYYIDKQDKSAVAALYQVDGLIPRDSFTVIMGPSGCGKTTLLKCICGLSKVDGGRICFDGEDVTDWAPGRRNISYISQEYALYPHKTVFDNVAYPLQLAGTEDTEIRRRVREVLTLLDLALLGSRKPRELSGGQQQRVALARALVKHPAMVVLDEPLSNIDPKQKRQLMDLFRSTQEQLGISFLYVTHSLSEARYLARHLLIMDNGEIVESGDFASLYQNSRSYLYRSFVETQAPSITYETV